MENYLLHTPGVEPPVHIVSCLAELQRPYGGFAEDINLLSLPRFEP